MKYLATLLLVFLLLFSLFGVQARTIQNVGGFEQKAMNATLALYGQMAGPQQVITHFLCSATAIQKQARGYILLSAGHCTADEPAEVTFAVADDIGGKLSPVTPIKVRLHSPEDVSLWYYETDKKYPVVHLGDETTEKVGNEIINPNFTQGLAKQLSIGLISSDAMTPEAVGCDLCAGYFLVHEQAGPGASGSAVISKRTHKIIGLLVIEVGGSFGVEPISVVEKALTEPDQFKQVHQQSQDDSDDPSQKD